MSNGRLIVIEGLDGSGKATQSERLYAALRDRGETVRKVSFPRYESEASAPVRMYLGGAFGTDPNAVNAYAASSFYAIDRYASFKQDWGGFYDQGGTIIADRYTTSNAIHQCAKLPREQWDGFLAWLFDYEYTLLDIPKPDLVMYLQTDNAVSQRLMSERYHGDESRKDIHESNTAHLDSARLAAEYCCEKLGWLTVHCVKDGEMRRIEDIHRDVMALVLTSGGIG